MTLLYVDKTSIDKALFAKIMPRKLASLAAHSGNVRKIQLTDFVDTIEISGIQSSSITKVYNYSDLTSNGKFFWDRDNNTLYVYYDGSLPKKIIVIIAIFVTTTFDVLQTSDPNDQNNPHKTIWLNRLQETSFEQSCLDQLNGTLGISSTNISLINNDSLFNYLAGNEYSFKNCNVLVWVIIDLFSNRSLIFKGLCQNASWSGSNVILDVIDQSKIFQQEASLGDDDSYYKINKTKWPNSLDDDQNKYIPFMLAPSSINTFKKTLGAYSANDAKVGSDFEFNDVTPDSDLKGIYVGLQSAGTYQEGKKYALVRTHEIPIKNYHLETDYSNAPVLIESFYGSDMVENYGYDTFGNKATSSFTINTSVASIKNLTNVMYAGMRIYLCDMINTFQWFPMWVTKVDSVNNVINIRFDRSYISFGLTPTSQWKIKYRGPTVYAVKDGIPCYLQDKNYYFVNETTNGNNYLNYLVVTYTYSLETKYYYFVNNEFKEFKLFLNEISATLNDIPDIDYYVRFLNIDPDLPLADSANLLSIALKSINSITTDNPNLSGKTIDISDTTSSFYHYQQNLGTNSYQDIIISSDTNATYIELLQNLLFSSFGFICTDSDGKIVVRCFKNQPEKTICLELTEDDIKDGSVTSENDFSEFASILRGFSTHMTSDPSIETKTTDMRLLVGDVRYNFKHYLKSNKIYNTAVRSRVESYKFNALKMYSFKIINKGYDLTLGDQINIRLDNSGKWLVDNTIKNLFIVKINKSLSGVTVECIENIFP